MLLLLLLLLILTSNKNLINLLHFINSLKLSFSLRYDMENEYAF